MSTTEACTRCTTPKPSETNAPPAPTRAASSSASAPRSVASLDISRGSKRTFSSNATAPSNRPATAARAESPTMSVAAATGVPSSSPSRAATGASEYSESGAPFGRPRWAVTTTRAPAPVNARRVGREARIRPSSVIRLSPEDLASSGTLRSVRTSTVRPATPLASRSSSVLTVGSSQSGAHQDCQVSQPVGIAPFVVVPTDDLDLAADHLGQRRVEYARGGVGDDVRGHDWCVAVAQDALEWAVGGGSESLVDLLDAGVPGDRRGQVGDRSSGDRHPQRVAVELSVERRQHQPDGYGGPGGGRYDVDRGCPGPAQVLVRGVLQVLVLGVGVDGGHQSLLDAQRIVEHLGHRAQAVGGARGAGDHRLRAVQPGVIDPEHHGEVLALGRSGDDHPFRAALVDMLAGVGCLGEKA